jgi:polyphosphate kinase
LKTERHAAAEGPSLPAEPQRFLNRELGQLAFNRRVLAQAQNPTTPLLERLRFLCIVGSNLDEFFEIRVSGLKAQMQLGSGTTHPDGASVQDVLQEISAQVHDLVGRQYAIFNDEVLPALAAEGVRFLRRREWTDAQREWIHRFFLDEAMPVLTPIGLDPAHPFPRLLNKSLNFAVELSGKDAFGRNSGTARPAALRAAARGDLRLRLRFRVPVVHPSRPRG